MKVNYSNSSSKRKVYVKSLYQESMFCLFPTVLLLISAVKCKVTTLID